MATNLPPPMQFPFVDANGNLTLPWLNWMNQLYQRVGGGTADSITDVSSSVKQVSQQIPGIIENVSNLESSTTSIQAQANNNSNNIDILNVTTAEQQSQIDWTQLALTGGLFDKLEKPAKVEFYEARSWLSIWS